MKLGLRWLGAASCVVRVVVARARTSAWTAIAVRVLGIGIALGVLSWVGRFASAGPSIVDVPDGGSAAGFDAGLHASAAPAAPGEAGAGSPVAPAAVVANVTGANHARASPDNPVILNDATVDDLRRLPGVGEKRAAAILALRQRVGRFSRVEDLLRVKGVGRNTLRKWRPLVRLDTAKGPADAGPTSALQLSAPFTRWTSTPRPWSFSSMRS